MLYRGQLDLPQVQRRPCVTEKRVHAECPIEYLKSSDGKTCELRTYPFNKYYVPFPFLMLLTLMFMIIAASYVISKKATLIF